jgi:ABC-type phosphate/phosphonate transport system substrate-binding protein
MVVAMSTIRFVLPPSLGESRAGNLAEALQVYMARKLAREVTVYVAPDYAAVEDDLLFGSANVAWAPPSVCARLQAAGGRFLLHAVRSGISRYRSGLVCRRGDAPGLDDITGLRAAWVSPDSTAGYLLPRQWFKDRGVDVDAKLMSVRFCGSYTAAVRAVVDGVADITAVFASSAHAEHAYSALDELPEQDRDSVEIFAFTSERLNDGIVFAPDCDRLMLEEVRDLLRTASDDDEGRQVLREVFNAEAFVATEVAAYQAAYGDPSPDDVDPPVSAS